MPRLKLLAASLLCVAAAAAGAAAPSLTAEQIVDKNVQARGGLQAWRAVQTLTLTGKIDAGGKDNHELPFIMRLKRPNQSRMEVVFNGQTAVQVYDGTHGWKVRPFLNRNEVENYTPDQLKAAAAEDALDGPLVDYAAKGSRIESVGLEAVEGKPAYHLKVTTRSGHQRNLWVDANTFLEVKIEGEPRILDGKPHKVAIFYRDFKNEHGLLVPGVTETVVEGVKASHKLQVTQVGVNEHFDDALFQKPQAVAAGNVNPVVSAPVVAPGGAKAAAPAGANATPAAAHASATKP